jgi:predicted phosphodiesterase
MRVRVFSDLHLEFAAWEPPPVQADVVVLAGDIHVGTTGLEWARRSFPDLPIVYVAGNHEFYEFELDAMLAELREAADRLGIHFLDGDSIAVAGARFLGATLWTDFELNGRAPGDVARAMSDAKTGMLDYRLIRRPGGELLRPEDTQARHRAQAAWLAARLGEPFAGPTVVVTHYLPHRKSIHPRYAGNRFNPCFASDLAHLVRAPVALWIHGHTHESLDYRVGTTRVVCNPRGYLPREPNRQFDPGLLVEPEA